MTCYYCAGWAPKTWEQLRNRLRNVQGNPNIRFHQCPMCHGEDWATSREHIGLLPTPPDYSTAFNWRRWLFIGIGFVVGLTAFLVTAWYVK